jgi:single-stranded-DNA-specific exonuclease
MPSVWRVHPADPGRARALAGEAGVHPVTAQLLLNRGVRDRDGALRFLQPDVGRLEDPFRLPEMSLAVGRLRRAIDHREPILIFGDSDVDGLTATAILYEVLKSQGAIVSARQSNRITGGYGLPRTLIQAIRRTRTKVLILVDCGTNQPEEIRLLHSCGIDTIIVDHHVPLHGWARPCALVNPRKEQGRGHGDEFCSAGLALKVAQAFLGSGGGESLGRYLDLAALGTLADCSPLTGENRAIVSEGLPRLLRTHRPGLSRLCEATKVSSPDPDQVIRRLIPRINASGRLGDTTAVWKLLLGEADERQIEKWLLVSEEAHGTTKQLHRQVIMEAQEQVNRLNFKDEFVMIVSAGGWHRGLMGPLASQLSQRYHRPAIAIAMDGAQGTGSGRSVPIFNLLKALQACQDLLVRFGGHAQACGLTVDRKHLEAFHALVNQQARRSMGREGLMRSRLVDLELPLEGVTPDWVEDVEGFEPFGQGNPRPTVAIRNVAIEQRSARTAVVSDGTRQVAARGAFAENLLAGRVDGGRARCDLVASPALEDGELVLMVSDVKDEAAPWGPVRT